ncbi:hypothetical protein HGP16_14045 [Rhizobium sp. P40RR-XXII]|uniref:DUF6894 family protein n=1 Tax=unclassified Rhizobium TaxID=2613769 RepID=UPI00145679C6|nr:MULTISPECIES: hypothetical protein [unclassified Rhizobium]NLR85625.1 hypothetical protein [Rhizobium sp. P28RR-XV]NLS17679.1 hypothetical protein [Rhizobium sp. P40RR-XXII]
MTTFYFVTQDSDCIWDDGEGCDLPDLMSAIAQAKNILAEMAADGIPQKHGERLVVEIAGSDKLPIVRLALLMEISYPAIQEEGGDHSQ